MERTEFVSFESFYIPGKGTVTCVRGIEQFDPRPLVGSEIVLDGRRVRGVETFSVLDPSGLDFGILSEQVW